MRYFSANWRPSYDSELIFCSSLPTLFSRMERYYLRSMIYADWALRVSASYLFFDYIYLNWDELWLRSVSNTSKELSYIYMMFFY
jgi:hypothetical protein